MFPRNKVRRGAAAIEAALVMPVMMLLLLFLVQGGLAIFRSQQVTAQAREAARYACVHGKDWAKETKKGSPTEADIFKAAVLPLAQSMDVSNLTCKIEWIDEETESVYGWNAASKAVSSLSATGEPITHRVRVTVTYSGSDIFLLGALTFTAVTELPMSF